MDPHAAHIVFDSARHITMLGLDVTSKADIRAGLCSPLEKGGLIAQTVAEGLCRRYAEFDPFLHDPCVIAYLIKPEIFQVLTVQLLSNMSLINYSVIVLFTHLPPLIMTQKLSIMKLNAKLLLTLIHRN
ncbi:nucleoside hydrolase [Providencia huaxiensis]|uniref:nucleoside hydrolase n=1 Tax=Providencia huaxiensis TaxID=2027290 RepID=UPI0034DCCF25